MKIKAKKIIGIIFQIPLLLIVIASFFISIYLGFIDTALGKSLGITYGASIISGIVIILYFIGAFLKRN